MVALSWHTVQKDCLFHNRCKLLLNSVFVPLPVNNHVLKGEMSRRN
jgi:hypothetical protein